MTAIQEIYPGHPFFAETSLMLTPCVALLPQAGSGFGGTGRPLNAYSLLVGAKQILVDAGFRRLIPQVRSFAEQGHEPAAMFVTHSHVVEQSDALEEIQQIFNIPILLHPNDATSVQSEANFESPIGHPVLADVGAQAIHFRGHTEGSCVLYHPGDGGVLFAGDSCVGPRPTQPDAGYLVRIPPAGCVDELALKTNWQSFDRPVAAILQLHGAISTSENADISTLLTMLRREEITETM